MYEEYFEDCRCPKCRMKLDEVTTDTILCPSCGVAFDKFEVWRTRRYRGNIPLPAWVAALLWPSLVILLGVGVVAVYYVVAGSAPIMMPALILGVGFAWFGVELLSEHDD